MGRGIPTPDISDLNGKKQGVLSKIIQEFGGVIFAIEAVEKTLKFIEDITRNKKLKKFFSFLRKLSPGAIGGYKAYTVVKKHRMEKKYKYAHERKSRKIANIMGLSESSSTDINDFDIGKEVSSWLLESPKNELVKVVEYYNGELEPTSPDSGGELIFILLEFLKKKFMIEVGFSEIGNVKVIMSSYIHSSDSCWKDLNALKAALFKEFVQHFDVTENVIYYRRSGLFPRKRTKVNFSLPQFPIPRLAKEISNVLEDLMQRAYLIIGNPGTGKSLGLMKLESEIPFTIIYVSPSAMKWEEDIAPAFSFFRSVSPCVVIFEDMDGYDLTDKNRGVVEFMEQMDSLKQDAGIVFISTLNDPSMIHYALVNRRGRFDEVILVKEPDSKEEVQDVLKNHYEKKTGKEFTLTDGLDDLTANILKSRLSQADICEIINKTIVGRIELTVENLVKAYQSVVGTREVLVKANWFSPNKGEDEEEVLSDAQPSVLTEDLRKSLIQ